MFIFSTVDYGIHAYIGAVKYIVISKICFIVLFVQIPELCREVTIENDIFVSLLVCSPKVMFLKTTTILGVSLFEKS